MLNKKVSNGKYTRIWTLISAIMIVALLLSGCGQAPQAKVYRVGILNGFSPFSELADGFKAGLANLGYVEGKSIIYDVQSSNFDPLLERSILDKFVADKVDLIYTFATESAISAKDATKGTNIPVVFAFAVLEENDLVQSIGKPGGNVTGVRFPAQNSRSSDCSFCTSLHLRSSVWALSLIRIILPIKVSFRHWNQLPLRWA